MSLRNHRARTALVSTAAAAVALVVLAGCGGGSSAPSTGGASDGDAALGTHAAELQALADEAKAAGNKELIIYGASADSIKPVFELFQKRYGIEVKSQNLIGAALTTKLEQEITSGNHVADVVQEGKATSQGRADSGFYLDYTPFTIDDQVSDLADAYRGTYAASVTAYGIAYNTDKVKEADAPTSWAALNESKWKNSLTLNNPAAASGTTVAFGTLLETDIIDEDYIRDLGKNGAVVQPNSPATIQSLATGQTPLAFGIPYNYVKSAIESGAPVASSIGLKEGALFLGSCWAIMEGAPNTPAAKLFVNWLFTPEAQEGLAGIGDTPLLADVTVPEGIPVLSDYDPLVPPLGGAESAAGLATAIKVGLETFK